MIWLSRWVRRVSLAAILVLTTVVVGGACQARWRLPELEAWHRVSLEDIDAADLAAGLTYPQYRAREERLFSQVRAFESTIGPSDRTPVNRYHQGSLSHPQRSGSDWNQSFETEPPVIRGGALLIHGLTDSPYSMRAVAERPARCGYLLAGAAHAGAWHRAFGSDSCDLGRLASGRADGRPACARQDSGRGAARARRLFQRRSAGPEIHARGDGGRRWAASIHARAAVADDWRDSRGPARLVGEQAGRRAVLREVELAGDRAGIQSRQIQFLRGQRRVPDGVADTQRAGRSRPARFAAASSTPFRQC